ncbi:hypothetical protein Nepgr_003194 [Nepenthes gracilis]|uniref:Uncharacterized protein n=1 Tax=Nepenthes gracilis TaxID=150966 RepID=A0AAD3RZ13_NEPGR|nr:hypothetical protein Nepgr_003194 [Nepenthes gracilis]
MGSFLVKKTYYCMSVLVLHGGERTQYWSVTAVHSVHESAAFRVVSPSCCSLPKPVYIITDKQTLFRWR